MHTLVRDVFMFWAIATYRGLAAITGDCQMPHQFTLDIPPCDEFASQLW